MELAERFGTPVYVVSEPQLRRNARRIVAAFEEAWPEGPVRILPSIKANFALALRSILTHEGLGCDAVGAGELEAALRCGVPPEMISLNGPIKDPALLGRAVGAGVRVTLDSVAELEAVRRIAREARMQARVRLRLRPDLHRITRFSDFYEENVPIWLAAQLYKPGIPTDDLLALGPEVVEDPNVDVTGVHMHVPRHGTDPGIWREAVRQFVLLVGELRRRWGGWEPREIDLGGGFPVPRDPTGRTIARRREEADSTPGIEAYAEALTDALRGELEAIGVPAAGKAIEVEPGRSLYGDAGVHLARVQHVKRQGKPVPLTWVETDTSEAFLADVNLEHSHFSILVANRAHAPAAQTAEVVGMSCGFDVLAHRARVPVVRLGDVLAFLDTGAYQEANASNFNAMPRPATVLVNGCEAEVIKRAETVEDVFARDVVPARLGMGPAFPVIGAAREGAAPVVLGLDHVSVTSGDLERSLCFYHDLLGLSVLAQGEAKGGQVAQITGMPDAHVLWADLSVGRGQVLELFQYLRPEGDRLAQRTNDPGATHLAFAVDDVAALHRKLLDADATVRSEPAVIDEPGDWEGATCLYALDPDGVTIELIERPGA